MHSSNHQAKEEKSEENEKGKRKKQRKNKNNPRRQECSLRVGKTGPLGIHMLAPNGYPLQQTQTQSEWGFYLKRSWPCNPLVLLYLRKYVYLQAKLSCTHAVSPTNHLRRAESAMANPI